MHTAADQIRVRPDSAVSTPLESAVSTWVVRSTRSRTCGTSSVAATRARAPNAPTISSFLGPSVRQPVHSSTSA